MAKNKGMFNPKYKQKVAAQQASNKEFFKNNPGAYITNGRRVVPKPGDPTPFSQLRNTLQSQAASKLPKPMAPTEKPTLSPNAAENIGNQLNSTGGGLGLANQIQNSKSPGLLASLGTPPASIAAQRMQNNPMSPPPGKAIGQALPPANPSVPAIQAQLPAYQPGAKQQNIANIASAQPAAAPTTIGPAQQMQAQKDQMFPPAPAAPVAPAPTAPPAPIVPKPAQITPPAGVTKSQADIDEEKKKLQAAAGSPV